MASTTASSPSLAADNRKLLSARLRQILSYALLVLLALTFFYPFYLSVITSFRTLPAIAADPVAIWPENWTLDAYQRMESMNVQRWLLNSTFVAVVVTLSNLIFASMAGYALARIPFPGSNLLFLTILGTMMIPGIVLLIPRFIIFRFLGIIDTYWGLILPMLVLPFGIFLMRQFFEAIPGELEEAARMDGANRFQIFFIIVLPLAQPTLIALTIFTFQGNWNEFMNPLIVIARATISLRSRWDWPSSAGGSVKISSGTPSWRGR